MTSRDFFIVFHKIPSFSDVMIGATQPKHKEAFSSLANNLVDFSY